jgi:hypothetical protein
MDHSAVVAAPRMRWEYAAPSLAALVYPFLLQSYIAGLKAGYPSLAWLQLGLAFCVSLLGFFASVRLGQQPHPDAGAVIAKRLAWLAVAAPPLYTGMGVLLTMAGDPLADTTLWLAFWITAPLLGMLAARTGRRTVPPAVSPRLRVAHGISALAIVLLFLAMHLFNHLAGLLGEAQHRQLMALFRHVYRADLVEPLLVVLFGFQLVSGLQMLRSLSARPADVLRTLQAVSAAYLLFFILAHMNSVFFYARRFAGIPTDWNFATGAPTGLLHDAWNIRLVPHYTLGVFLVLAHLLLGLRQVLLAHGRPARPVDAWTWAGIGAAALFALAVMTGMSGVHLLNVTAH